MKIPFINRSMVYRKKNGKYIIVYDLCFLVASIMFYPYILFRSLILGENIGHSMYGVCDRCHRRIELENLMNHINSCSKGFFD